MTNLKRHKFNFVMSLSSLKRNASAFFYRTPTPNVVLIAIVMVFFISLASKNESELPIFFAIIRGSLSHLFENSELFAVVAGTVFYLKEKSNREIQRQNEFSNILKDSANYSTKALIKIFEKNKSEGISFSQRNFSGIRSLKRIDLSRTDMSGSVFKGVDLTGANLKESIFYKSNLHDANMEGASLRDADLREANLHNARLNGASLQGADLREANLFKAQLKSADLNRAKLGGADLTEANLYGADLTWVSLKQTYFKKTIMPDGSVWNKPEREFWNVW